MIEQSVSIPKRVMWFTSLLSQGDNLPHIEAALKKAKVVESRIIPMAQGQKQSRLIAWTFFGNGEREKWRKEHWSSAPAFGTTTPDAQPAFTPAAAVPPAADPV
jgi:23S rRNA (adenine1618-N6)-methyltransferase